MTDASPPFRRILGNLDFETSLARARRPQPALPRTVRLGLSALATLLRVFAREGDRLWTPLRVEADRVPSVPGVAKVHLESGPLHQLPPAEAVLAWGMAPEVERYCSPCPRTISSPARTSTPLQKEIWQGPFPTAQAAARVNHRSFFLDTVEGLGRVLPGTRMVHSLAELDHHLARGGAGAAVEDRWVLKASCSAAGRDRLLGKGNHLPAGPSRQRAARLFQHHEALLFEPWMERIGDFGCTARVTPAGVRLLGIHRQAVDGYGRFRGLIVEPISTERPGPVTPVERNELIEVVQAVGIRLRGAGYVGPFGLDGWWFRDRQSTVRFHPLGEINARCTFGLALHVLAARLEAAGEPVGALRFRLGRGRIPSPGPKRPGRILPLLLESRDDPTLAWVQVTPPGNH